MTQPQVEPASDAQPCTQFKYTQANEMDYPNAQTPCETCGTKLIDHLARPWQGAPPVPAEQAAPPVAAVPECLTFAFSGEGRPTMDSPCANCGVPLKDHPFGEAPVLQKKPVLRQGTPVQRTADNGPQGVPPTMARPTAPVPVQVMRQPDANQGKPKNPSVLPDDPRASNRYQCTTMPGMMVHIGIPIQALPLRDAINLHYWLGQAIKQVQAQHAQNMEQG